MKNRTTAGILAILLGGLGVHRFYLGQIGLGILYLVFCWTFIPSIIALVDGIIFLTKSDDEFNLKYGKDTPVKAVPASANPIPAKQVSSIKELFSHDFEAFDDKQFNVLGKETNSEGKIIMKYRKALSYKEAGLFDIINVNDIEGSRNYTFENGRFNKADYPAVESLITSLYYLLGKDSSFNGLLTVDEKERFLDGSFPRINRMWTDEHLTNPVMVTFDKDGYELTVFGFKSLPSKSTAPIEQE